MFKQQGLRSSFYCLIGFVVLLYAGCAGQKPTGENVSQKQQPSAAEGIKITSLDPSHGARGSTVVINGSGFSEDPSQLIVRFDATQANIKNSGSKLIVAEVPPSLIDGKYNIVVTNKKTNQTSGNAEFFVHAGETAQHPPAGVHGGSQPGQALVPPSGARSEGGAPADTRPASLTVPSGTTLVVRSVDGVSSGKNRAGEKFELTLDEPLVVGGRTVARKGSTVIGRITQAKGSGRIKGRGQLAFTLVSLKPLGHSQTYEIRTNSFSKEAPGTKKRDAEIIGGGAGVGALVGALAGGKKGAAIGAAVGGGAGTGTVVAIKGKEVEFPPETRFTFKLQSPLTIR